MAIFSLFTECRAPQKRLHDSDDDSDCVDHDLILLSSTRSDSRRLSTRRPSKVRESIPSNSSPVTMVDDLREGTILVLNELVSALQGRSRCSLDSISAPIEI